MGGSKTFEGPDPNQRSGPVRSQPAALLQQSKVVPVEGGGGILPVSTRKSAESLQLWRRWAPKKQVHGPSSRRRCNVPMQCHSLRHDSPEVRLKASKLEQALDALEGTNGAEVDAIKKALVKAKAAAHEKPLTEMIADCKGFIDRAEKRLEKLEAERRVSEAACWKKVAPASHGWNTANASGHSTCFRVGSRGVTCPGRVGQCALSLEHQHRPSTSQETVARGFRPKHCRRGSVVDEMPATRNGGSNFDGPRGRRLQACLCDCGGRSPAAAVDSTTFKCWEHGKLRVCVSRLGVEEPPAKIVFHQCGFRGCRIGDASNLGPVQTRQARRLETAPDSARHPGPTSRRRRRRALPWSRDSDTESDTDPRLSCGRAVGTQVDSSDVPSEPLDAMERDCEASHS